MRLTEPRPKTWLGAVPKMTRLMTAIVLLNGSLTNSCHARLALRVRVHEHAESRLDTLVRRIPAPAEERLNRACRRQTVQPLERVLLDDGAVGGDNGEYRLAGADPAMGRGRLSPPRPRSASLG